MLNGFGGWHALVLLVIVVLIFGATRLPGLAKSVGQSMKIFRNEMKSDSSSSGSTGSGSTGSGSTGSGSTGSGSTGSGSTESGASADGKSGNVGKPDAEPDAQSDKPAA